MTTDAFRRWPRSRRGRLLTLAVAVSLAALTLACGGDDSTSDGASASASSAKSAGESATVSSGPTADSTPASIDLGSGGGKFCDTARDQMKQALGAGDELTNSMGQLFDPATRDQAAKDLADYFKKQRELSKQILADAPKEIKADMELVFAASDKLFSELEKANFDFTKIDASAMEEFNNPEFEAAATRIEDYVKAECGIDLNS